MRDSVISDHTQLISRKKGCTVPWECQKSLEKQKQNNKPETRKDFYLREKVITL